jgi:hypothetical protein
VQLQEDLHVVTVSSRAVAELSPSGGFSASPTSAAVLSRLNQLMSGLTLVREGEQAQDKPEQAVSQMRGALVVDKCWYRQFSANQTATIFKIVVGMRVAAHNAVCLNHLLELFY